MKILSKKPDVYINVVYVRGQVVGLFRSYVHWATLGSKRAIVEKVFNRYEPEVDIYIVFNSEDTIPILSE